ncbi:MAG: hypothetical protein UT12_C0005G0005 [Candidatus Curtissbacteria bacterium GW2011_GWC2_38_9]|uniref:Uncharacterized protein n=3 Tax=Candidatus Curtissiibacteriota TaxID=1752717 RepID=A0A1F5HR61_9BACT|nr:MAG: hypothetical protein UT12_C0005G0005 [Candidatus Curtissbacteria bacterium GW2011_GWC2_38_9]KKS03869.1 MAG: hypothetical protein UU56_C0013G0006 [Candidatus Curtissbacteria bacterium GW2011_GWA2_41_24]OGD90445.1 MAG: hypothetical protein A2Z54_00725 [Candidatus Curtissbacteria bacterium RIFCSPHIGHO2_02_39_8]OGE06701.1 MAG: hypothetical protein A2W70_04585 [Candidatus Curtissbacteria bacterium RIFCSPLOWO2_02_41_11]
MRNYYPIISLIFTNLIPIFGILFLQWNLFQLLFVYSLETAIIGLFFNLRMIFSKIITNQNQVLSLYKRIEGTIFGDFGLVVFIVGHATFIYILSITAEQRLNFSDYLFFLPLLFISHSISFFFNFIRRREYKIPVSVGLLLLQPYKRVLIMHLTIVIGGIITVSLSSYLGLVIPLIILKTLLDLIFHLKEHNSYKTN